MPRTLGDDVIESLARHRGSSTVAKAFVVLEYLAEQEGSVGISECARDLGMDKATVFRLVRTLVALGYAVKDSSTDRYRIGTKALTLSKGHWFRSAFGEYAKREVDRLCLETGESANLAGLENGMCVFIYVAESQHAFRMASKVGSRDYLHSTAVGKAMLSRLPESEVVQLFQGVKLPSRTPNTIVDLQRLVAEIRRVCSAGYALDNEETEMGALCIGAAIVDPQGRPVAGVSVSGPKARIDSDRIEPISQLVRDTAKRLSDHFETKA